MNKTFLVPKRILAAVATLGLAVATSVAAAAPTTQNARRSARVVFLVDASDSMKPHLPDAVAELGKAVDALRPDQLLGIVAVAGDEIARFDKGTMALATPERKAKAREYLAALAGGGSNRALPDAHAAAVKLRPDVMWFVSDGRWSDGPDLVKAFGRSRGFRINTTGRYAEEQPRIDLLVQIATQSGGVCVDPEPKSKAEGGRGKRPASKAPPRGKSIFEE